MSLGNGFKAVCLAALVSLSCPVTSYASLIVVSGDTNIANALAGVGTPVNPGNQRFFENLLGVGTTVGVLSTSTPFVDESDTWINDFYNSLAGVSSSVIVGTVTAANLAGLDLFVAPVPDDAFTAGEIAALSSFLTGGGSIFFSGENRFTVFDTTNNAINAALTGLGSGLQIVPDAFDPLFYFRAGIVPDPLSAGVTSFTYAASSRVSGGTAVFLGNQGQPFVAYEGTQQVPEPATVGLLALGCGVAARRVRQVRRRA